MSANKADSDGDVRTAGSWQVRERFSARDSLSILSIREFWPPNNLDDKAALLIYGWLGKNKRKE